VEEDAFEVDVGALRTAAGTAGKGAEEVNGLLGPFGATAGQAATGIAAQDAGDAMLLFGTRWGYQLLGLAQLLVEVSAGLIASADHYQETDQAAATSFTPGR
jgi:uncharacterized protein YukE